MVPIHSHDMSLPLEVHASVDLGGLFVGSEDVLILDLIPSGNHGMSEGHFMWNVLNFLKSFQVMVHVSALYSGKDMTRV